MMFKRMKVAFIIGAALILSGTSIFGGIMMKLNWDFTKLSTVKYISTEHNIDSPFKNIFITTNTASINIVPSVDGKVAVICYEEERFPHTVTVTNDTLEIKITGSTEWYDHIGINFGTPKITIQIPPAQYGDLTIDESSGNIRIPNEFQFNNVDINTSTGDIELLPCSTGSVKLHATTGNIKVENISASSMELSVTTGDISAKSITCTGDFSAKVTTGDSTLQAVTCKNFTSTGNTGDLSMDSLIATETIRIKRTTGDIKFTGCDANELTFQTGTGYVKGSLLTDKIYIVNTDTGRIDVPNTTTGGKCEVTTTTGDIKIEVLN